MQANCFQCLTKFKSFQFFPLFNVYASERKNSSKSRFEEAVEKWKTLNGRLDVETKLKLYGFYKQALFSDVSNKPPGKFNFVEQAKHDAWKACSGLSKLQAKKGYEDLILSLLKENDRQTAERYDCTVHETPGLKTNIEDHIFRITLDRSEKCNALTLQDICRFKLYINSDLINYVIFGSGSYYSSGNDIENLIAVTKADNFEECISSIVRMFENFVKAFIEHEKPLLIFVNGPAIGIAVTTLPLADYVMASEEASFHTPFTALGISPEGCSTYTFPLLMGLLKASEMLLFGRKLSAHEAMERNLVNEVISAEKFEKKLNEKLDRVRHFPREALILNKRLIKNRYQRILVEVNQREIILLKRRWMSEECRQAIENFRNR